MRKLIMTFLVCMIAFSMSGCVVVMKEESTKENPTKEEITTTTGQTDTPQKTDASQYQGYWVYENGTILEIADEKWNLYNEDGSHVSSGIVKYDEDSAALMNEEGSSGGGRFTFDENGDAYESGNKLEKSDEFPNAKG